MSASAMLLLLGAASLHATWNTLTKRARDPFAFLWMSMVLAVVALTPVAIAIAISEGDAFDPGVALGPIAGSGAVHALYFMALAGAYRHGDLSVVYPIARGLGVGLVPLLAAFFLGERIAWTGAVGIAIVVLGIATTGLSAGRKIGSSAPIPAIRALPPSTARPIGRGVLLAIVTGVLIAAYSILDRTGARAMHPVPFLVLTTMLAIAGSAPLAFARRASLLEEWRAQRGRIALASTMNLSGYLLVLFAFRVAPTPYVVAGREIAIALAAAAGMTLLGEPRTRGRIAGALLVVAGVTCVALSR